MSRQVDLDDLTADDVEYMRQRPWLIAEAKLRGVDNIEELMAEAAEGDSAKDTAEFVSTTAVDYGAKKIGELRTAAKTRGLSTEGSKKDLVERLSTHDQISSTTSAEAAGAVSAVVGTGEDDGETPPAEPVTDTTPPPDGSSTEGDQK